MAKYLLIVDYRGGAVDTPMDEWTPEDIRAHMDYYGALRQELLDSGELVDQQALTGPEHAKEVTSDGVSAPVVTDGPFAEFKEMLAGFQLVEVDSEARAIEIAAKISQVPGPGGVPQQQPIGVRRVMGAADFELLTSEV
ncbi:YciI family protein [Dactylosporangium siamense]|uniref:Sigma associated protein n=1 Tax=Dactylosporangium siamense TaxID=685454 RepID=A0A919PH78_9ACTN|nr:YciI family protein [Dactylosporangium siamense]GIG44805.1 sigma associated protein [Dactylosporangium siamense]